MRGPCRQSKLGVIETQQRASAPFVRINYEKLYKALNTEHTLWWGRRAILLWLRWREAARIPRLVAIYTL